MLPVALALMECENAETDFRTEYRMMCGWLIRMENMFYSNLNRMVMRFLTFNVSSI